MVVSLLGCFRCGTGVNGRQDVVVLVLMLFTGALMQLGEIEMMCNFPCLRWVVLAWVSYRIQLPETVQVRFVWRLVGTIVRWWCSWCMNVLGLVLVNGQRLCGSVMFGMRRVVSDDMLMR